MARVFAAESSGDVTETAEGWPSETENGPGDGTGHILFGQGNVDEDDPFPGDDSY